MGRGRPTTGPKMVEQIEGTPEAQARARWALETLTGTVSIPEACAALGLSEARFHELRHHLLGALVHAAEGRPAGRPPKPLPDPAALLARVQDLERHVQDLRIEKETALVREELALALPHLRRSRGPGEKKTRRGTSGT